MAFENNLYGLAYGCPYIERKDNCPLKVIDQLSFQEKVEWIDRQSEARKKSIYESHLVCHEREENNGSTIHTDEAK